MLRVHSLLHKNRRTILTAVILGLIFYGIIYTSMIFGNSYGIAAGYIKKNDEVLKYLGNVNRIFLISGTKSSAQIKTAKYDIFVVGEHKSGRVEMELTSTDSSWLVSGGILKVDGNIIDIAQTPISPVYQ